MSAAIFNRSDKRGIQISLWTHLGRTHTDSKPHTHPNTGILQVKNAVDVVFTSRSAIQKHYWSTKFLTRCGALMAAEPWMPPGWVCVGFSQDTPVSQHGAEICRLGNNIDTRHGMDCSCDCDSNWLFFVSTADEDAWFMLLFGDSILSIIPYGQTYGQNGFKLGQRV